MASHGIGKTTLARILAKQLGCETLFQPCSIDGSIDMVKTVVNDFTDIVTSSKFKVIILDEADQLSQPAQMALRDIIVESMGNRRNCRFILTANYEEKIIPALTSRCQSVKIDFSMKDVVLHCSEILKKECISFTKDSLKKFSEGFITNHFPDIRAIVEKLQASSLTGKLDYVSIQKESFENIAGKVLEMLRKGDNIREIRKMLILNEGKFSADYVELAKRCV